MPLYFRNPDENIRDLERRALAGDPDAQQRWYRAQQRARQRIQGPRIAFHMRADDPRRVDLENCIRSGPNSTPALWDGGRVYWSPSHNSYVMVYAEGDRPGQFWHPTQGQVNLYSVNGYGEIRWDVSAMAAEDDPEGGWGGEGAARAFGLVD